MPCFYVKRVRPVKLLSSLYYMGTRAYATQFYLLHFIC
uniref:Uncharacterized protein n=1 Tax=Arundo donax TaxID=35708 RepID=A0A0A9GUI6_ARUDO